MPKSLIKTLITLGILFLWLIAQILFIIIFNVLENPQGVYTLLGLYDILFVFITSIFIDNCIDERYNDNY